jgi:phosphohistidine phosphatase
LRQLLLMRHAKSSWDDPGIADHERPLNARGRRAATAMRGVMRDLGLTPDIVLVSTARRTMQTLEGLEPWEETPLIETMDTLYLADRAGLFAILRGVAETARSVMLIGHNPGLHELALALAGPLDPASAAMHRLGKGYPTCALAEFTVPGPWRELGPGAARLVRFVTPRDLPEHG